MKTRLHLIRRLLRAAMLLLAVTCSHSAMAQEEIVGGEAFYIYQNDGHFDGFFYDEVQQINYSRLDTLGVEYDEYVSQEIVTADSTYRIMLTAIDSVSFVQPEIRYAKGVRLMLDEGMIKYYVKCEDMNLSFNTSMPASLRPKVGEVLTCAALKDREGAFVGKVVSVKEKDGLLVAECDYVKHYNEVFEQFITVEEVSASGNGGNVRRRIAGLDKLPRAEGIFEDYTLFQGSADYEDTYGWGNLKLGVASHLGFGMSYSLKYKITAFEFYVKSSITEMVELSMKASIDGQLGGVFKLGSIPGVGMITKVPFPATVPIFYVDVMPTAFLRLEAHLNVGISTGLQAKSIRQTFELMDRFPYISLGIFSLPNLKADPKFDISAEINGTAQFGVMFPIEVGTQEWTKYFTTITASEAVYAGPKVTGSLTLADLEKAATWWKGEQTAYTYFKDMKLDLSMLSLDNEVVISMDGFWGSKHEKKYAKSFTVGQKSLKFFPDISGMKCDITGDMMNTVKASFDTSGDIFLPLKVGFALYSKEDDNDNDYKKLYHAVYYKDNFHLNNPSKVELEMNDVAPGIYTIRPVVRIGAFDPIPVFAEEQLITIAPRDIELKVNELLVEEEGGEFSVDVAASLDLPITCESSVDWIKAEIQRNVGSMKATVLKLKVDPNDSNRLRTGTVTVRMVISSIESIERTLTVKQYGGLQLSPSSLTFEKEGGTQIVEVQTSMSPITVSLNNADWLDYELDGRTLRITASKNDGESRSVTVVVSGWSSRFNGINATNLTVTQKGTDPTNDIYITPTELYFDSGESSDTISLNIDWNSVSYTHRGARVADDAKDWVTIKLLDNNMMRVTVAPNFSDKPREGYVNCYVRKDGTTEDQWLWMPLKVVQGVPIPITPDMKFLGKWTYENEKDNWYVEYTFGSDGSYYEKWDTPSAKFVNRGIFTVNSYSEEAHGDVVMEASINERYKRDGETEYNEFTHTIKLIKSAGYKNGVWVQDAYRELQIGWNIYRKKE